MLTYVVIINASALLIFTFLSEVLPSEVVHGIVYRDVGLRDTIETFVLIFLRSGHSGTLPFHSDCLGLSDLVEAPKQSLNRIVTLCQ